MLLLGEGLTFLGDMFLGEYLLVLGTGETAVDRRIPGDLGGSNCRIGECLFCDFRNDDLDC